MNRRLFLSSTGKTLGAAFILGGLPAPLLAAARLSQIPIGFQTWVVRDALAKEFTGTLKEMAALGFRQLEMCSPKGYVNAGFGPLAGMPAAEMRSRIEDAGLQCPSCHFGFSEFASDTLDDRIQFAQALGMRHMIVSSFGLPKDASLSDYGYAADKLNKAAEKIKSNGLQAGYHNHSIEFATLDGKLIYDALMQQLDPSLVKMQFQTEVINLGYKAATYFNRYPGRFVSAHLSDWTAGKEQAPVGQGVIDWKGFFAAAKTGGVQTFFVEMEPATFKESIAYLQQV